MIMMILMMMMMMIVVIIPGFTIVAVFDDFFSLTCLISVELNNKPNGSNGVSVMTTMITVVINTNWFLRLFFTKGYSSPFI